MSTQREHHMQEMAKSSAAARLLIDKSKASGHKLTPDEENLIDAYVAASERHRVSIERIDSETARRELVNSLGVVSDVAGEPPIGDSPGDALVASAEYAQWREGRRRGDQPKLDFTAELPFGSSFMAAAGDPILEGSGTNGQAIAPTWSPVIATPGLTQWTASMIQAVIPTFPVPEGNVVNYAKVLTRAIPDMTDQVESEVKSPTDFSFGLGTRALTKFTAFSSCSDELAEDAPALVNYINREMGLMVLQKEERAIAQTLYTASTTAATGYSIASTPTLYDLVLDAMTQVRLKGGTPDVILLHPTDWARMSAARASTSGTYYSGGPYASPPDTLWGSVRQVITPAAPRGTPLVGDFRSVALFRKSGPRIEASNAHADFFQRDLLAIRAEVRSTTITYDPSLLVEVNVGS